MLLITATVVRILAKIRSSALLSERCHNKPPTVNFNATNSPSAGLSPNIGFVSYTLGCFKPLYVVYTSNVLTIIKYVFIVLGLDCENRNSFRFTFDLYVIDLSEASFRTLSSSEL